MSDPIAEHASTRPDATALVDASSGSTWTFAELSADIESVASRLSALDIARGDHVAILSETRPGVARAFFACWRLGAIAVPLNARHTAAERRAQLELVDPDVLLVAPPQQPAVDALDLDYPVRRIGPGTAEASESPLLSTEPVAETVPADLSQGDDVAYLFTSGTTGTPKAVRLTHGNFTAAADAHRARFGVKADDRWLCPLSTYHMGGLAVIVRSAFYGTTAVLQRTDRGFDPTRTRNDLTTYDCTAVSLVPVQLRRLLDDGRLPGSLRFVLTGGAPTPPELVERAHQRDVPVCPSYGMTETTAQVATPTPTQAAKRPASVGRPLDGVVVSLRTDDGTPVETGDPGEIVVRGPTVTPGYADDEQESDPDVVFDEDGFHTGDVGRMDDGGRLYVLNRREDRIITGGENVHPGEVADVLTRHPGIETATVLGMPHATWGEQVTALAVPTDDSSIDSEQLRSYAREHLADYKVPKMVAFVDELPRTASGTVDRRAARDELRRLTDL